MKTPQQSYPELAKAIGIKEVYLKREDQHKYGSHKGRSIPVMIKKYFKEEGVTNFVISSSGNAAIATIHAVQAHNRNNPKKIDLMVYIGRQIEKAKFNVLKAIIEDVHVKLEQVERPKQSAFQMEKNDQAKYLRQSVDDTALIGYAELAEELSKIPNLQAIFIPTSSGTTAEALGQFFSFMKLPIQIHIVQTEYCHPIAQEFDEAKNTSPEKSIAGAIVDNIAHRKNKVVEIIKNSQGSGWIISDNEIKDAIKLVKDACNLLISPNSALSVAGLMKAVQNKSNFNGPVVCLITGM